MTNTNFSLQNLEAYLISIFTEKTKDASFKNPGYVGPLGNGLYQLPYGVTGKGGWDLFTTELQRLSKNGESNSI